MVEFGMPQTIRHCAHCQSPFALHWPTSRQRYCSVACKNEGASGTPEARFWANVHRSEHGCWLWVGSRTVHGYGRFKHKRVHYFAHRYSLGLAIGRKLGPGEQANHRCDNRLCVNPDHLYAGTQKDNIRDAMERGRMSLQRPGFPRHVARGTANPRAKLDPEAVRRIRRLRASGWTQQRIADDVGVWQTTVSHVLQGKTWGHVA